MGTSLVPSLSAPVFTSLAIFRTASDVKTGAERLETKLHGNWNITVTSQVWAQCWCFYELHQNNIVCVSYI